MYVICDGSVIEFTHQEVGRILCSLNKANDPHFYAEIEKKLEQAKKLRAEMLSDER